MNSQGRLTALLIALAASLGTAGGAGAAPLERDFRTPSPAKAPTVRPGEILVGFEAGTTAADRGRARSRARVKLERTLRLRGVQLVKTEDGTSTDEAIRALEALKRRSRVRLSTDSQYVQKGISEWIVEWKRRGWRTAGRQPVKNADLWQRLDELKARHDIEWRWVKGHAGHPENERADRLANKGIPGATDRP